jgi:hypothetical protein
MAKIELDESVVDTEFLAKKLDYSKRIATNRSQRSKLRQELSVYKKVEKTGEKPLEDPKITSEVMNLKSNVNSEMELNGKLIKRLQEVNGQINQTKIQIRDVADLIQRYKVEQAPQIMNESNKMHLQDRKKFLKNSIQIKENKLSELKQDLERLKKDSETKSKQNTVISKISEWQTGISISNSESPLIIFAHQTYLSAGEAWREARFAYDRKNIMPNFYLQSWKALNHAVDSFFILLTQKTEDLNEIKIQEKIDLLYKNKIIVNTKLLDSLAALVDRINHGVEVSPTAQYPENILEFMEKNMISLKVI